MSDLPEYLEFAVEAAWAAGRLTLGYFQSAVTIERKADDSPVTAADRGAERLLRERIAVRYPDHAVLGEEYGAAGSHDRCRWVIDPIDGTKSFVSGAPLYGVLVGLEIDRVPVVGVCHFPALGETVAAASGLGCFWNGRRARVSAVDRLGDAVLGYSDTRDLSDRMGDGWPALQHSVRLVRGWGDCYGHCLVATGRLDGMLDPKMNPWDCCALVPIVQEAGGRFTDWTGVARIDGGDAYSTNGRLHAALGEHLASPARV